MQKRAEMFFGLASTPPDDSTAIADNDPVPVEPVTRVPLPVDVAEY